MLNTALTILFAILIAGCIVYMFYLYLDYTAKNKTSLPELLIPSDAILDSRKYVYFWTRYALAYNSAKYSI